MEELILPKLTKDVLYKFEIQTRQHKFEAIEDYLSECARISFDPDDLESNVYEYDSEDDEDNDEDEEPSDSDDESQAEPALAEKFTSTQLVQQYLDLGKEAEKKTLETKQSSKRRIESAIITSSDSSYVEEY